MLKEITAAVKAKKDAGAVKVRVYLLKQIQHNGRSFPEVIAIFEFETVPAFLKSGQLAAQFRMPINQLKDQYTEFKIEVLK